MDLGEMRIEKLADNILEMTGAEDYDTALSVIETFMSILELAIARRSMKKEEKEHTEQ